MNMQVVRFSATFTSPFESLATHTNKLILYLLKNLLSTQLSHFNYARLLVKEDDSFLISMTLFEFVYLIPTQSQIVDVYT